MLAVSSNAEEDHLVRFHKDIDACSRVSPLVIRTVQKLVETMVTNAIVTPDQLPMETEVFKQRQCVLQATVQQIMFIGYNLHSLEMLEGVE